MIWTIFSFILEHPVILTVLIVFVSVIYALKTFLVGPKPGPNPFSPSYVRRPPEGIETDKKVRNTILKPKFKPEAVPEDLDAIIIGSGISGWATAVMLGRAGKKVLVLEQIKRTGGGCHTYKKKGYEFDTGIHYVGKMGDGEMMRVLFDQISEGQVQWAPIEEEYNQIVLGTANKTNTYCMRAGSKEQFASNLEKQFPSQKEAINKLINTIAEGDRQFTRGFILPKIIPLTLIKLLTRTKLYHVIFRRFFKLCNLSLRRFLNSISDDKNFKSVVSFPFSELGVPPSELGMVGYSVAMSHLMSGAYYPRGGPSEIPFQLIPIIERYGGRVMTGARVTKILLDDTGKVNGIIERFALYKGGVTVNRKSGEMNVYAKTVISAAGVRNTFQFLLPKEAVCNLPIYKVVDEVGPSISCLTVFIGLNGSPEELGLKSANTWLFNSNDTEVELRNYWSMSVQEAAEVPCPLVFVSLPSAKDPSWEQKNPGKSVALLITLTPWYWFSQWKEGQVKRRGDDYKSFKMKIGQRMWHQAEQVYPQLADKLDFIDVGTPLTNKYYLGQPEGEMYGLDHGKTRFQPETSMILRPESGVPGLYLTGQDIVTSGFCGALYSSVLTVGAILNRNILKDLTDLTKEVRKNNVNN